MLAGDGWSHVVRAGEVLRIVDLEGNQAVDRMFYDAHEPVDRYDATQTIRRNRQLYLTTGAVLSATRGTSLMTIIDDTCGRHDTVGGACSCESNQVRYAFDRAAMHSCRDTFLLELARHQPHLTKRDIGHNVNFFLNVPVTSDGGLRFADAVSAPGRHVELRAERDVLVVGSNCPQLTHPCNGWNPTPVRMLVWIAP